MNCLQLLKDKQWRKQKIRYWLSDPFWGGMYYIGHYFERQLPITALNWVGKNLGHLAGKYRFKAQDARVRHNLLVLQPQLTQAEREITAEKFWEHFGQTMVEYSQLDKLYQKNRISVENREYLQPYIERKQAVIFVTMHTGNWEIWCNCAIAYGLDLMALYMPLRDKFALKIAHTARQQMGVKKLVESNSVAMRLICKHLSAKGALWIAIDECKKQQVNVPSFGRKSQLRHSNLSFAIRLAQRYDAVIIPVWTRREKGSRFTVKLDMPITVLDDENAFTEAFLSLEKRLETWIMNNLEQWYMLHELRL